MRYLFFRENAWICVNEAISPSQFSISRSFRSRYPPAPTITRPAIRSRIKSTRIFDSVEVSSWIPAASSANFRERVDAGARAVRKKWPCGPREKKGALARVDIVSLRPREFGAVRGLEIKILIVRARGNWTGVGGGVGGGRELFSARQLLYAPGTTKGN